MKKVYIYSLSTKEEPDNIRYIGKATDYNRRFKQHLSIGSLKKRNSKNKWLLSELYKGYTPIINIIDEVSETEWQFWEQYWICQFKTWSFDLTNKTVGGDGFGSGVLNVKSGKNIGNENPFFGKTHKVDSLKIIQNSAPKKSVDMYSKEGNLLNTFISIREAAKATNLDRTHISACCNNKPLYNTVGGYVFKFKNEPFEIKIPNLGYKSVIQKDKQNNFINKFTSISEAVIHTGCSKSAISACCNKIPKYKTAGGFKWEFA